MNVSKKVIDKVTNEARVGMIHQAQKIVITGATGFAGSHILEKFGNKLDVIAACRSEEKLPQVYRKNALIGNLRDESYTDTLTQTADVICHAASWAELNGTVEDSKREFLDPTLHLIDKAVENGVKRFVFLSSISSIPVERQQLHTTMALEDIWAHYASIMKIEEHLKEIGTKEKMEVVILRVGFFVGENYALGLLPILLPRLKTHLVPYIERGSTTLPLIDGRDIAKAFMLAATLPLQRPLNIIDIVGKQIPTVKEVFVYLHKKHGYPLPHFSVSFDVAYIFARFMRALYNLLPADPLIVPSIVLLLEETYATNDKAKEILGYEPEIDWKQSVDVQIEQMQREQKKAMRMNKR